MIKGVIFDLWNTLIVPNGARFAERLARLVDLSQDEVTDYFRSTGCLHKEISYLTMAMDLWYYRYHSDASEKYIEDVKSQHQKFVELTGFSPNAEETIHDLKSMNFKVGIVSNATSASLEVLNKLKLDDLVDDVRISCISGFLKPDPRAFLDVADEWSLDPDQICVVGDKITTDVLGSRLAGMPSIWYSTTLTLNHSDNHTNLLGCIKDLREVIDIVVRHNDKVVTK